jgi:hypothetical protein
VYSSTSTPTTAAYFENAIGRLSVHPQEHYIAIEYHNGPRRAAELHSFLTQADHLLARWGWDKLQTARATMSDFTAQELEEVCAHWRTEVSQRPALVHGSLLLPHKVFVSLSRQTS